MRPMDLNLPERFMLFRQGQLEAITAIASSKKFAYLLDAPTGVGKSLIGVGSWKTLKMQSDISDKEAGNVTKRRCVYLTKTKQLQTQIVSEFPIVKSLLGRSNYPCLVQSKSLEKLKADSCNGNCLHKESCPYLIAKREAIDSPITVLNTAYFLSEANGPGQFSNLEWLICDEVDTLENSLMDFINLSISEKQCHTFNMPIPDVKQRTSITGLQEWVTKNYTGLEDTYAIMEDRLANTPQDEWTDVEVLQQKHMTTLGKFMSKLDQFLTSADDTWVISEEPEEGKLKWNAKPVTVAKYAERYLWRHCRKVIGMSGSILDHEMLARELGIPNYDYSRMDSPFPTANRPIYYIPVGNVSYKTMDTILPKMADKVQEIINEYPTSRILAHTMSYKISEYLIKNLKPKSRVTNHLSNEREEKLKKFKNTKKPMVMLSPSFDRGVDLPAGKFDKQVVIICKMPYLTLGDPQVKARMQMHDGQRWYDVQTLRTLVQMSGRMQRSNSDKCDVYILDSNFENLLNKVGHMLPSWWIKTIQ